MAEFHAGDVIGNCTLFFCDLKDMRCGDIEELGIGFDKPPDQPRAKVTQVVRPAPMIPATSGVNGSGARKAAR